MGISTGSREVPGRKGLWQETSIIIIIIIIIIKEPGVQLDKKRRYEHVPKSVETSQGGKVEPTSTN